jgi:phosphoenolpyruvate synthase/pyruvate phosphate dikinase
MMAHVQWFEQIRLEDLPKVGGKNASLGEMYQALTGDVLIAKQKGRKIGICGQAPSDYPEFAEFLVKEGIDSISLNPDSVIKTMIHLEHPG